MKTLTADELIKILKSLPKDTKVYLSKDPEGNGYGSLTDNSIEIIPEDKLVLFYPVEQYADIDSIAPNFMEKINK